MRLILPDRRIILPPRGWRPEYLRSPQPFVRRMPGRFTRLPLSAAITVRAVGAVASATSGPISPGLPAGTAADDVLLCIILNGANDVLSITGTWAKKVEVNNSTNHRVTLAWFRAIGGDSAPTISGATQDIIARIVGYVGVIASGDPFDGTPTTHVDTSATATVTGDAITPANANDMIVFCGGQSTTGSEQPTFSGYSGINPTFNEEVDNNLAGNVINPAIFLADGTKTDTTSTGNRTATSTSSLVSTGILAALIPVGGGGGPTPPPQIGRSIYVLP